jgi:hypothetical protein
MVVCTYLIEALLGKEWVYKNQVIVVGFFNPELHFERRKKFTKFLYLVLVGSYTYRWMLKSFLLPYHI